MVKDKNIDYCIGTSLHNICSLHCIHTQICFVFFNLKFIIHSYHNCFLKEGTIHKKFQISIQIVNFILTWFIFKLQELNVGKTLIKSRIRLKFIVLKNATEILYLKNHDKFYTRKKLKWKYIAYVHKMIK